jgi:phage head maturation protease
LTNIDLREISIVSAWPAYDGTTVNARNTTIKQIAGATVRLILAQKYLETVK